MILPLDAQKRSPGIRTFQASLLGLLMLAGALRPHRRTAWRDEILAARDTLQATVVAALPMARAIANVTARAPVSIMLGAGPCSGIARYAAAKRIEASGSFAAAQDMEEWWHVERFSYPTDMPVIVIAPPGPNEEDGARTALNARGLGRHVVAVCGSEAASIHAHANAVLPLIGSLRHTLYPLVSHPALTLVAAEEALILGRMPFQQDRPQIRAGLDAYLALNSSKITK